MAPMPVAVTTPACISDRWKVRIRCMAVNCWVPATPIIMKVEATNSQLNARTRNSRFRSGRKRPRPIWEVTLTRVSCRGSVRVNRISNASSRPGRPTTRKAARQP